MVIKALKPFVVNASGALKSFACGQEYTVSSDDGNAYIADGLAVEVTEITPTGTVNITENGETDVTQYATASVAVPEPTGSESITANGTYNIKNKAEVVVNVGTLTVTYNANGGTGTVDAQTVIAGNSISLDDGSGLTPPENKVFAGWATTDSAETPDATSPYTPTADTTLYAVYVAES